MTNKHVDITTVRPVGDPVSAAQQPVVGNAQMVSVSPAKFAAAVSSLSQDYATKRQILVITNNPANTNREVKTVSNGVSVFKFSVHDPEYRFLRGMAFHAVLISGISLRSLPIMYPELWQVICNCSTTNNVIPVEI